MGLAAACTAFGNAKVIVAKLEDLFDRLAASPARTAENPEEIAVRFRGWKQRFVGADLAWLLVGARSTQRVAGSLEVAFQMDLRRTASMREALIGFCDRVREAGNLRVARSSVGTRHLLPDHETPAAASGCCSFFDGFRPADGVDLGLWSIDPARLLVPVDVHLHRLGQIWASRPGPP